MFRNLLLTMNFNMRYKLLYIFDLNAWDSTYQMEEVTIIRVNIYIHT